MAFFHEPSESLEFTFAERLYTEAFARIGLEFRYKVYPPTRAGVMADSGQIDGEPGRIKGYNETYKNLIRVDEPLFEDKILACATNPDIVIEGWESLRGTDYRVDYYRGIAISEKKLPDVVNAENLYSISEPVQALKKLVAGRIEVYVDSYTRIVPILESPEFKDSGIRVAGVLEGISTYPYLHKRHAALAPKLAEALKQMKTEGLLKQYLEQAKQQFAQE